MSLIEDIMATRKPNIPPRQASIGLVWVNMLIEYDYLSGSAKVLRSFTRPAKESTVKLVTKPKKVEPEKIIIKKTESKESLF